MKPALTFSLVFLAYWFEPTIQILTRRRFLKEAKFVVDYLHQLSIIPLRIHNVSNSFHCAFKCIELDECLSFNLGTSPYGGSKECQLLSFDKCDSTQHLKASKNFDYYSASLGVVQGNNKPCKNGGQIQPFYWTGTYKCACPTGTQGMHCGKNNI
ncbi:uncharacterized protein LOC116306465 [Actinia tenebrosa]|uniref:Uncharacterized protein LOC116306465 n=1 Tax=Actinia tenebrosa TaxID=6105 RepID=A0A6P8IYZ5_ACTTE|nr:uncharacterized protein LOC116306465 [Actinia tenebrosa]